MITLESLIEMKAQNEKTIEDNDAVIVQKQAENIELQAENRVFDKLIKHCQPEETVNI